MAERRSALAGRRSGTRVRLAERVNLALFQVSAFHGRAAALRDALDAALGIRPPERVGQTVEGGGRTILCVGPGRFWIVDEGSDVPSIDPALGAVVDQSHGRTVIEIEGASLRDLLAKGCAIDLAPSRFPAGACAATRLGHFAVVLHARAEDRVDVHVARSYAHSLWSWLDDAALEFESGPAVQG